MANPFLFTPWGEHNDGITNMDLVFTSGASGAVPTTLTRSNGIKSVTKNGTGTYDVVLRAPYTLSMGFSGSIKQASYSTGAASVINVTADTIATDGKFTFVTGKGTDASAVDMSAGDVLHLTIRLQGVKP